MVVWLLACLLARDNEEQHFFKFPEKKNRNFYIATFFFLSGKFLCYPLIWHNFQLTAVCCSCLTVSQSIRVLSTLCWVSISTARKNIFVALGFYAVFRRSLSPASQMFRSYHVLDYDLKGNKTNTQSFEIVQFNVPHVFSSKSKRVY